MYKMRPYDFGQSDEMSEVRLSDHEGNGTSYSSRDTTGTTFLL